MSPATLQLELPSVLAPVTEQQVLPQQKLSDLGLFSPSVHQSIGSALRTIFPESKEENKLQRARSLLGEVARDVPDEQLEVFLTELQFLIESWLDSYEQQLFNGLTLRQVLRGG